MNGSVGNHAGSPVSESRPGEDPQYRHGAAVVSSREELVAVALPYLEEGLRAGDLTVLSCPPDTVELLRRELREPATALVDDTGLSLIGARPPDVFSHVREYAERARAEQRPRLRVLAESRAEPGPERWREEMRVDAVFNEVMAQLPVMAVCLYDRERMPDELVTSAALTHPRLLTAAGWVTSDFFESPASFVRGLPVPRAAMEDGPSVYAVDDAPSLPHLRHALGGALDAHVGDPDLRDDLHLALSEVAANAFRHGRRPVSARLWTDGLCMICTISDGGTSFDDPLAGFVPAHGYDLSRGGMGLWLARKLWDHVDLISHARGFTVRLSTTLANSALP